MSAQNNEKISIDQLVFKSLYYRYKAFLTPLVTIFVCLLLFVFVVVPQIQNWLSLRDTIQVNTQDLAVLHQNLSYVTKLDEGTLANNLQIATSALPTEKDFAGIISSLTTAAGVAGASLDDYSFQLGDLNGFDQQGKAQAQLPVQLNVILKGGVNEAQKFIHQLKIQLPLSDAIAVSVNSNASVTVTVVFYYATLPKIVFKDTNLLPILSADDQKVLDILSTQGSITQTVVSSASAQVTPKVTPISTPIPTLVATGSAR